MRAVADRVLMESVYEGLQEAAEAMDLDAIEEIMEEISDYAIPKEEQERFKAIETAVENLDYQGVLKALKEA